MVHGLRSLAVLIFLLTVVFSGCFQPEADDAKLPVGYRIDGSLPCDTDLVLNCEELTADPAAPIKVRGLRIDSGRPAGEGLPEGAAADTVGLTITRVERDVVVQNVEIFGFQTGILIENLSCPTCTIRIEDARIQEEYRFWQSGEYEIYDTAYGITVREVDANLRIEEVEMELPGGGYLVFKNGTYRWGASAQGLTVQNHTGALTVEGLRMHAQDQAGGPGMLLDEASTDVKIRDIEITNFGYCINAYVPIELVDATLRGCQTGLLVYQPVNGGVSLLRRVVVEDATWFGMELSSSGSCTHLDPVSVVQEETLVVTDSSVSGSGLAGIDLFSHVARIERTEIIGNGMNSSEDAPRSFPLPSGIQNRCGTVTVRESIFEDNQNYGYHGFQDDVRENWWGSERGPRVWDPWYTGLDTDTGGDAVPPEVVFVPYLTERPDLS